MILDKHEYYFDEIYKIKDIVWTEERFEGAFVDFNRGVFINCDMYPIVEELRDQVQELQGVHYEQCYISLFNEPDHFCPFHHDYVTEDQDSIEPNMTMVNLGDSRTLQYRDADDNILSSQELPIGNVMFVK